MALVHGFYQAVILQDWPLVVLVQKVEWVRTLGDRMSGRDGNKASVVVKTQTAERITELSGMGQVEILKVLLDIDDLLMFEPNVHAGVMGHVEAAEVHVCAVVVVQVHSAR